MKGKILVMEDNPQNRLLMTDLLRWHGYEVMEASDGAEGMKLLEDCQPDLVLLDIQMPSLSGIDVARAIRKDPRTAHIKIVAVTSLVMKGDQEKFRDLGLDDYIHKPVDTRQLPAVIQRVLEE